MQRYQEAAVSRWIILLGHPQARDVLGERILEWSAQHPPLLSCALAWHAQPRVHRAQMVRLAKRCDPCGRHYEALRGLLAPHLDAATREDLDRAESSLELARHDVLEHNIGLVGMLVRRRQAPATDMQDMMQEGMLGLIEALRRFDPERGTQFSTYAVFWVRNALRRCQLRMEQTVRIPDGAAARGHRLARVEEVPPLAWSPTLDAHLDDGRNLDELPEALECLPQRERWIISHRFGLQGCPRRTLQELGTQLGVSRQRIRQLELRALARIRARLDKGAATSDPHQGGRAKRSERFQPAL